MSVKAETKLNCLFARSETPTSEKHKYITYDFVTLLWESNSAFPSSISNVEIYGLIHGAWNAMEEVFTRDRHMISDMQSWYIEDRSIHSPEDGCKPRITIITSNFSFCWSFYFWNFHFYFTEPLLMTNFVRFWKFTCCRKIWSGWASIEPFLE